MATNKDILKWIQKKKVRTNKGLPIEFRDHGFLLDYIKDVHNRIVIRKCTQIGASFSTNIKMVHLGSQEPLTTIYCVDPKTEIMTEHGWRFYYDLKKNNKIITLNMNTGESEWKPLNEIFVKKYDGDMISWESRNISALSTPNHKWPVHKGDGKLFFKQTQEINSKDKLYIPKAVEYEHKQKKLYAEKKTKIKYNGIVWCPSTDNGTFLAKRNGTVYWTGNTLPTSSEAKNFVLTKFDPMIERSPGLLEMVQKVVLRERVLYNSVVKRIGQSYYFFRGCIDEKTEVLTCRGWQTHLTIKKGEKLPTINMETGYLDIQNINSISEYDVDEELINISNKNVDMLLTKDHRCLLRSKRTGKLQIKHARNLNTESSDYIPFDTNGLNQLSSIDILPETFKIIGCMLSEESCQTKRYNDYTIEHKVINLFPDKKLTIPILFKMDRLQLQSLFDGLMLGGGSVDGKRFYQSDKSFCDAFQVLVSLLGKTSRIIEKKTKFIILIKNIKNSNKFKLEKKNYTGKVWCPSTDNGTIIIRRNGKVQLTGQSWTTWGAQSIDADVLVVDELDFQKPDVRQMWEERTEGSASQDIIFWIGYPSIPNFGIEELYENSDMRKWFIECNSCYKRQVLEFPDNINMKTEKYICKFCKKELSDDVRRKGIWKITKQGRNIHGYWVNKLMAPWISADKILHRFRNDLPKKFHNYTLGLPYVSKETELDDDTIKKALINDEEINAFREAGDYKTLCGVDQGDIFHMLIALANYDRVIIIAAEQVRSEEELKKRFRYYGVDTVVMDMFPNRHTAKTLCKDFGHDKFFMAKERNWSQTSKSRNYWKLNRATSEVGLERTESLDSMIEYIQKGVIEFKLSIPRLMNKDKKDPGLIQQIKNLVPDTQERFGLMRRVFKAVGPEHYGHALNFLVTACHISFPGWMNKESIIRSSYMDDLRRKKKKPWYIKEFEEKCRGLNPNDSIIIKPGGEVIEPEDDFSPRIC